MKTMLHIAQPSSTELVGYRLNYGCVSSAYRQAMGRPRKKQEEPPHQGLHYIAAWAEKRGYIQADFVRSLSVDKGTVSRWFNGHMPDETNLPRIAAFLSVDVDQLFRAPEDDWIRQLFYNRSVSELQRIKATLEAAFPREAFTKKDGTNG